MCVVGVQPAWEVGGLCCGCWSGGCGGGRGVGGGGGVGWGWGVVGGGGTQSKRWICCEPTVYGPGLGEK